MNPEDRILVGVINTKRDFEFARDEHWYRIPQGRAPKGIDAEYLAFFQSGKVFGDLTGGIHYFAERKGIELARRKELVGNTKPHKRDNDVYHKIQLGELIAKMPPIWNKPKPHRFAFIYTTWDRFEKAGHIRDLYSQADYFVDRVFHVLRQNGLKPRRTWESSADFVYPTGAQIRILAEGGEVVASTEPVSTETVGELIYMKPSEYLSDVKISAKSIIEAVHRSGGPKFVDIPIELY